MNRTTASVIIILGIVSPLLGGEGFAQVNAPSEGSLSADAKVVRQILDQNGCQSVPVLRVAIERDGRVVELKLLGTKTSAKNLPSSLRIIPPEIGKLEKLEKLVIASNDLPELPATIYDLINLTELSLSNNTLRSLAPKVGQLRRLQKLDVGMNGLAEVPASLATLSGLKKLDLSLNHLQKLPDKIGDLAQLEDLNVRLNLLRDLPASTAKLKRLQTLDLIANRLEEVPALVYGLASLQALYLSQNEIRRISPKIGSLTHLESLTLDNNKLTDLPDAIRGLVGLEFFGIEGNQIEDIDATLARIFPGKRRPRLSETRQDLTPEQAKDSVFTISKIEPLPDGRPVIDIKPNGKNRPAGTGPSNSYYIVVRRNGVGYYLRWFSPKEAATGTQYDLNIPSIGLVPADKLTVSVENLHGSDAANFTRLSNVLDVPQPSPAKP